MENPFVFGISTSGDFFTDREADTERLSANFKHGVNTIIISPRRWGKTSLVKKVAGLVHTNKLKVVCLDAFSCRTEEDFYQLFATEVIKQTSTKWEEWADNAKQFLAALVPKISFGIDPLTDFSLSLDFSNNQLNAEVLSLPQRIARQKDIRIVVCIDEFQQIAEFHDSKTFQKKLRSVWQLQTDVSYCLYGSKKHLMSELFSKQSMPFYKFGDIILLQKISTDNWISFIVERFKKTKKNISSDLAKRICQTVENHSSYVQQLSWLVWLKTDKSATDKEFELALADLLNQNSMLYYRYVEGLTAYQINFLHAIADGVETEFSRKEILEKYNFGTSANITRLKRTLEQKELIDISAISISFNDPMFRLWFKKEMKKY